MSTIDALVRDFFLSDDLGDDPALSSLRRVPAGSPDERTALAAALTIRDARPIPADVLAALERLLARERAARGEVDAGSLPTLADESCTDRSLPVERIALWRGDLTRLRAGAIVNAANSAMLGCFVPGHACVDNVIHAAAGPRLRAECAEHMQRQGHPEPTGTATVTAGFELPARYVVHTVGPIVRGSVTASHEDLLRSSYTSVLDAAEHHPDIDSIGLCSVSTGVFGYPKDQAAAVALNAIADWNVEHADSTLRIVISLFSEVDEKVYRRALADRGAA